MFPLTVPLWDISPKLTRLCLFAHVDDIGDQDRLPEQNEVDLNNVEAPLSSPLVDDEAVYNYHTLIICRAIIAAARGCRLRLLSHDEMLQMPFALRTLLPFWVQMEVWDRNAREWRAAARALRLLLAHTSYLLVQREIKDDRLLLLQDVQTLLPSFKDIKVKDIKGLSDIVRASRKSFHFIESYLTWLNEDEDLAQQVADAWNAVVKRGEAGTVECACDECPVTRIGDNHLSDDYNDDSWGDEHSDASFSGADD